MAYTCYGPRRWHCGIRHATHDSSRACRHEDTRLQLAAGVHKTTDSQTYEYDKLMKALERIEVRR